MAPDALPIDVQNSLLDAVKEAVKARRLGRLVLVTAPHVGESTSRLSETFGKYAPLIRGLYINMWPAHSQVRYTSPSGEAEEHTGQGEGMGMMTLV